jgi:hypothetical protein
LQRVRDKLHTAIESRAEAAVLASEAEALPLSPVDDA